MISRVIFKWDFQKGVIMEARERGRYFAPQDKNWDSSIDLSAFDYPLVTQDGRVGVNTALLRVEDFEL